MKQISTKQSQPRSSRNSSSTSPTPMSSSSKPRPTRSVAPKQQHDKYNPPANTLAVPPRIHKELRSKSVSIERTRPHSNRYPSSDDRKPSAPSVMIDEKPRLSIADRFMSTNYEASTTILRASSSSSFSPSISSSPRQQEETRTTSPSASTISNCITVLSSSSDTYGGNNNKRHSVADRFANKGSSTRNNDRQHLSPKNSTNEDFYQYKRSLSPTSDSHSNSLRTSRDAFRPSLQQMQQEIRSFSFDAITAADQQPRRLTIADAFMKRSSLHLPPTVPELSRLRAASFAGELELDIRSNNNNRKNSHVHPLDAQRSKSSLFDDRTRSYLQSPELSLSSSSASSSLCNSSQLLDNHRKPNRPWGSQDTLVQQQPVIEKKKPIYAQFMESEKDATLDTQSFTFNSYSLDAAGGEHISEKESRFSGYRQYENIEDRYRYFDHQQQQNDWAEERSAYGHEPYPFYDDEDYDEEKGSYYARTSTIQSVSHTNSSAKLHDKNNHTDIDSTSRGFWIGCCFISCGQRPSRQSIMEQQQLKQQKKKRERELQQRKDRKKREEQRSHQKKFGKAGKWRCGTGGCCCLGRKACVFCIFLFLILSTVITYFLWPRTPLMRIEGASLTLPAKISETRQGLVGNVIFESEWLVNVTVDNRQNHIPTRLSRVQVLAKDALTGLIIGKDLHDAQQQQQQQQHDNSDQQQELLQSITLPPNSISTVQLPIRLNYQARDSTDPTFVDIVRACAPNDPILYHPTNDENGNQQQQQPQQRESLPLHFWITLHFYGLDWLGYKPTLIATPATGGFACPLP
ncbi:hypothetical protein BDF20DRAFT_950267 [Mycotypha africana]|uniref:uncharacterized protein n=1 Tax=Mycotypha africana TaxID=64632 RepID=UPI002300D966|nr:uncharacterized protein BDF20DRAFT_950267 [Mycotypha africana]KAI8991447.1 hypothetical protein BDF20DRAFT_950267 [Mycotypha africana]